LKLTALAATEGVDAAQNMLSPAAPQAAAAPQTASNSDLVVFSGIRTKSGT
jgi:hypothetical protein